MIDLKARGKLSPVLDRVGRGLNRVGATPTAITLLGLAITFVGAGVMAAGELFAATLIMMVGALLDAVDGSLARIQGVASLRGAFIDTISDRFGEVAMWVGLGLHLRDDGVALLLCLLGLAFSLMTPYVRARAEGWGAEGRGGWMGRAERLILFLAGTGLAGLGLPTLRPMLWAMMVLTGLTVAQRIRKTWGQLEA